MSFKEALYDEHGNLSPPKQQELSKVCALFMSWGVQSVIITLGAAGAFFMTIDAYRSGGTGTYAPARKARVVDTTAAGDTFVGACAVYLGGELLRDASKLSALKEDAIVEAVRFAQMASAKTVEKEGAQSSIPFGDQLVKDGES